MSSLEQDGEEVVGQARCPFESRQSNVGLFAGELSEHQPPAEADTKSLIISLVLEWHFTKRRKCQRDSSDHSRIEIQKGRQGDENTLCSFFLLYTSWTELNSALWLWCCCCIINTHFSLPRRWLLFCYDDGFSGERCSDLSKFGREQSCPAHSQIRLEMATGWVAWPGSNTCQGCVLFIHLKWMSNFIFCVCVYLEPHFLHAIEYGNYVYFFLSEIAVEYTTLGKVRPTHFSRTRTLWF